MDVEVESLVGEEAEAGEVDSGGSERNGFPLGGMMSPLVPRTAPLQRDDGKDGGANGGGGGDGGDGQ